MKPEKVWKIKSKPEERLKSVFPPEPTIISPGIKLIDAGFGQCRYSHKLHAARELPGEALICGLPTKGLCSWCKDHFEMVYSKRKGKDLEFYCD